MLRRRPILICLSLLLLTIGSALALFLYTFDLNHYRSIIQKQLSQTLGQPVRLGSAALSLRHGLAFEFSEVRLGEENQSNLFTVDRLRVHLKLRPLLQKQIILDKIALESPRARIQLSAPDSEQPSHRPQQRKKNINFLHDAQLQLLAIENGTLILEDLRDPQRPLSLALTSLNGRLSDLGLGRPASLALGGELIQGSKAAKVNLQTTLDLPTDPKDWTASALELELSLEQVAPAPLLTAYLPAGSEHGTKGEASLHLRLHGSPSAGLDFAAELIGDALRINPVEAYREPISIGRAALEGTWRIAEGGQNLENLKLSVDKLQVEGELQLKGSPEGTWLEGALKTPALPLADLKRLLPDRFGAPFQGLKSALLGGTLSLQEAKIAGPWPEPKLKQASLQLHGTYGPVEKIELLLALKDNRLKIVKGQALLQQIPLRLSGTIDQPFSSRPQLALQMRATSEAGRLLTLLPEAARSHWQAAGAIPLSLKLSGEPKRIEAELSAGLEKLSLSREHVFDLPAGLPSSLEALALLQPGDITLQHARLVLPPFELQARGTLKRDQAASFALTLDLPPTDLGQTPSRLPFLTRMRPDGKISGHYELAGTRAGIDRRKGWLELDQAGMHLTQVIADLDQVKGTILFEQNGLRSRDLRANIGYSPVRIQASLDDFSAPRLELAVSAKQIKASDLMFRSQTAILRDLDGHLAIDGKGLHFTPVTVRLDGGTRAVVRGSVSNFKAPQTRLRIDAEYGNIDEVIALWKGPDRARIKTARQRPAAASPLVIMARAHKGNLYGLNFQSAEGTITLRNGILAIHPLHFVVDDGYCSGQVVVDGAGGPPSLLKISGHLENFAAAPVYQDLLRRPGLVSGTLRADFNLEGRLGSSFLATSSGGANLEVRNGVLRKFKGLSKVFSLLNVSQIFALHLPDMASEGMPFNKLTANFRLQQGVLATEDLFIDSNAMNLSLVGNLNLNKNELDFILGVKPLRTVDKIVTKIPLAGWLLTGEEKALITAHFQIHGATQNPEVVPMPINSVSEKVLGIFKRAFNLPGKFATDLGEMIEAQPQQ